MSATQDDAHITATLKRKREDFMHGFNMIDQMLLSYEELLNSAGLSLENTSPQMIGASVERQNLQLHLHTTSMITQAETLLRLLGEVRYHDLFSNPDLANAEVNEDISKIRQLGADTKLSLTSLSIIVEHHIKQVEQALLPPGSYSSLH